MPAVWTVERVSELIDLWEDRSCLCNTQPKDYFNRDLRSKSLSEIAAAIDLEGE